ncbi:MAG: cyclic nucleotide-binding domain-containing protein [Leptospiraceae bacterium]|nr:cyclic nucleotide-binding domain-containing protein [Leptospiraceae bacterium]MDW8306392.1 cyclic nucleotide-binding domain-containing protein [Leptospiraceae bacterium]
MSGGIFQIVNFQTQAFVIVEGKAAPCFYIIRQGKIRLSPEVPIPGEEPYHILGPGDFFGVVSCMSGQPHVETAQCLAPTSLITVGRDQFGILIQKNAPIAMKIIRYFSQRLRTIDHAITKLNFHSTADENPEMIFDIAEFYYKKNDMNQAIYAYQKYLQYLPQGAKATQVRARLQSLGAPLQPPPVTSQNLARNFADGQMIMVEHEPGTELYIIQKGRVKITKVVNNNEVLLAVLGPGDIFGEMALLENKPRSASAVAFGPVSTLAINKQNFEVMVQTQPQLAVKLITILSERVWMAYRQLSNLLIGDPIGRCYDMLLTLVQKKRIPIQSKQPHTFDIGAQELFKMLGLPLEKSDQYIMQLLSDKNIRQDQGKLTVMDLAELEKQAQFHRKRAAMEKKRETAKL